MSALTVTPEMCGAVVDVVNHQLAEHADSDYRITADANGAHLWITDDAQRTLLWVAAHDNVAGMPWHGWVTADGRSFETLSEVEEAMSR